MPTAVLNLITSQNPNLLTQFDASNISLALELTSAAATSRLLGNGASARSNDAVALLSNEAVTYNSHEWGVAPSAYASGSALAKFYNVLSTNVDRQGRRFVSTIEARQYSIYGLQWHPEKASFEWAANLVINHNASSVVANNHMARFFVEQCRASPHTLVDQRLLIFNYARSLRFTGDVSSFDQCYVF